MPLILAKKTTMLRNQKILYICQTVLFILFCALIFVPEFYFGGKTKDYPRWFRVGSNFLSGQNLYDTFDFLYPPFAALLMAIPVAFGKIGHYLSVLLVSMGAWVLTVQIAQKMLGDHTKLKPWQILLPILLVFPFLVENFDLGQPNVILLALMIFGFFLLRKNFNILAGLSFGTAVAIKFFPITVLPYLLWRRYWITSITLIVSAIALNVFAPAPFRGLDRNVQEIGQWFEGMKGGEDGFGQRNDQNWSWKNQSIIAMTHRLVRHLDYLAVDKTTESGYINVIDVDFKTANLITLGMASLIGILFIIAIPRFHSRTPLSDNIEISILFCLMIISSPLARNYYFVWLYFPLATIAYLTSIDADLRRQRRNWALLIFSTMIGLLALPIFPKLFQAAGNYLVMTAILIAILLSYLKPELPRSGIFQTAQ